MTRTGVLNADEPDPVAIERPQGASRILLVCEHASNRMPRSLGTLGMVADALESHVAWDIGALGVSLLVQGDAELHLSSFDILEV